MHLNWLLICIILIQIIEHVNGFREEEKEHVNGFREEEEKTVLIEILFVAPEQGFSTLRCSWKI